MARIAEESWVMGCMPFGKARIMGSTCAGSVARECSSAVSASVCAFVGTSPVSSSQKSPSGVGSSSGLPLYEGSFSCSSGMV